MEEGRVTVIGRAEIDTRAPFKSVKEAVMLFGEKVLVREIYAHKINKEMKSSSGGSQIKMEAITTELKETKKTLELANEEGELMSYCIKTLREELDKTKKELHKLKTSEYHKKQYLSTQIDSEIDTEIEEEIKLVETHVRAKGRNKLEPEDYDDEFENKRCVKFASPPSLAKVIVSKKDVKNNALEKSTSFMKKSNVTRKTFIPTITFFSKKK